MYRVVAGSDLIAIVDPEMVMGDPEGHARIITTAPDGVALARMIEDAWGQRFDNEEEINGGDVVEWLGDLIPAARALLAKVSP
jgi:hypothetical protein